MKRIAQLMASLMLASCPLALNAAEVSAVTSAAKIGIVSVRACIDQSKDGHRARDNLENLNKQMTQSLEDINKQIDEVSGKLNDDDVRDSMAPEAEKALQERFENLAQEHELKRMQFSQQMNQAQMAAMQQLFERVTRASEAVATQMGLDIILQEDSSFYFNPKLDITEQVIATMNKLYEDEQNTQQTSKEDANKKEAAKKEDSSNKGKKEEPAKGKK